MIARCLRPSHPSFPDYGGRGIRVCDAWRKFEGFLNDMGERPAGLTLDRVDVDGDYTPENCRWVDGHTQRMNRRPMAQVVADRKRWAEWLEWADWDAKVAASFADQSFADQSFADALPF